MSAWAQVKRSWPLASGVGGVCRVWGCDVEPREDWVEALRDWARTGAPPGSRATLVFYSPRHLVSQEMEALTSTLTQALCDAVTRALDWQLRTNDHPDEDTATGVYSAGPDPRMVIQGHQARLQACAQAVAKTYAEAFLVETARLAVPDVTLRAFWAQWAQAST